MVANYQSITSELERLQFLKVLVETYEIIAASSMRHIRTSVLQNRLFYTGLNSIFQEVIHAYRMQILKQAKKKRILSGEISLMKKNGKTALVFISSNTGLYGDIVKKTFFLFADFLQKNDGDIFIVGRVGESLFKEKFPKKKFTYFNLSDAHASTSALAEIINQIQHYQRVVVFHGKFKSLILQDAFKADLSEEEIEASAPKETIQYLFEPSLETIAIFFETEIFASLLEQTFHESRLAKLASRLQVLDRAFFNIDNYSSHVLSEKRKIQHRLLNKKQLDSLTGVALWK